MSLAPTVLILAAGQGTRMRSSVPKVLHDLCGLPMVLWPVRAALAAGAGRVVVVDSPTRATEAVLSDGVELVVQPEPNGTGGAVAAAMSQLDEGGQPVEGAVIVLSGDVPLIDAEAIRELAQAHASAGAGATMVTSVLADPSGYGRVVRDGDGTVLRVVETKKQGDASAEELEIKEVNAGIYAFDASALRQALPRLSADNAQAELYLPQALDLMRADGLTVAAHVLEDPALMLGVNDRVALARARRLAQYRINHAHMLAGVGIVDPQATVIDADVQIGKDTVIEPFTTIHGATRIGERCTIRHSYMIDCVLEDGVSVGPFAYLRPGTVLREDTKIGTFVEVKNSDVGPAAKVPHLSYIGDADVGERSNLGAATITANYDGQNKHRTKIGKRVKGGVDTSFVAPVTVGDDAWTAAGSVVTEDVPEGALAVARAKQRNVEDYAERRNAPLDSGER
ncbi:MAG TPA: bifunctional UDP-N-acetylglucosamine diphosphorylase/glucosamine-1-phosphate N-acetyltransferase GlmU [Solirubrobacteraceae bacterium]|nr:bifunctional UDP-N-acetylglucosamine diphosphorylase/glucosamine-1-phosphate N-acetyltransferase GlmU [Solirubrobacteraceae bacterium]